MKIIMLIVLAVAAIISSGCETTGDLNPVSSNTSKPIFFMMFAVNSENGIRTVDVEFCTATMCVIPAVTVNSETLKTSIDYEQGIIRGELTGLQYKNTYSYIVSANRQKTTGEVTMPSCPGQMKCNGTLLTTAQYNLVAEDDSVKFSWDCESFDYFCYHWDCDTNDIEATTESSNIAFVNDGSMYYRFSLQAIKGPCPKPGTSPNVEGDCGDGFVLALSEQLEYDIWIAGTQLMKAHRNNLLIKDRIKALFLNMITQR